jgi:undecaprenyl phosphate-alpha-L-ara4N flippase subunit ArnE
MILSSIAACFGQMFWKIGTAQGLLYVLVGFVLYAAGAFVSIKAYGHGDLSRLQPINSLSYVFTILIAYFILDEDISAGKIVGIAVIVFGVVLIGSSDDTVDDAMSGGLPADRNRKDG